MMKKKEKRNTIIINNNDDSAGLHAYKTTNASAEKTMCAKESLYVMVQRRPGYMVLTHSHTPK